MIDIKTLFIDYIKNLHQQANLLPDGNVYFVINGLNFIFEWKETDPSYTRVMLPNIDFKNDQTIEIVMRINREYKVAKIIEVDNHLWAVAESFVVSAENIDFIFNRLIKLLIDVYTAYYEQKEQTKQ